MAATPDRIPEEQQADPENVKEQPLSTKNKTSVSPNSSQDAAPVGQPWDGADQSGLFVSAGDHNVYSPTIYSPQPQAFYYRGYDNGAGEWDDYPPYVHAEGLELGSLGVFNENPSLVFHPGYGYNPQMPYGPYSPVTTPLPSVGGDAQLYSPHQFPFSGQPYYQQFVPGSGNMPYITSPSPVSQPELTTLVNVDQQGDNMLFGPRPSYPTSLGYFGRGSLPGNPGTVGFNDSQQGFDGFRSGGLWSDWSKPSNRQRPLTPLSPAASPQPIGPIGQSLPMAPQQQRSFYPSGSGMNSYNRGYVQSSLNQGAYFGNASVPSLRANGRGWLSFDSKRRCGRDSDFSLYGCNGALDILSEQNRGPRASKPKNQIIPENNSSIEDNENNKSSAKIHDNSYNRPDFTTDYKDAKFFIIKSYSEDNVHKSIKYGVWASTPNGNKRLDAAYHEAMENQDNCPVFLFFSVNASAQFCGVAEMVGHVDFDKSVDYWQQDKWSGQFPVKWHIIKDVPNSQFRHIILENNDNKPVTNSRDTQEVKLEQGLEMLSIFKSYETDMSILDDFDFYEGRQKALQERKAIQQGSLMSVGVVGESEHRNPVILPNDFIKKMSKTFAQAVILDDGNKEGTVIERTSAASDGS